MTETSKIPNLPSWLNTNLLEVALINKLKRNIRISESKTEMATNAGDNYGSQMLRFKFTVEDENKQQEKVSVVAKIKITGVFGDEIEKLSLFENEIQAYLFVLPAINDLLKKAYPNSEKMWADCYYYQAPPNEILIFEDLRVGGFTLGNRSGGLNQDHAALVLKSLGKFHAASLVAKSNEPQLFEKLTVPLWHRKNADFVQNILGKPFSSLVNAIRNWPEFDKKEEYEQKLKDMENVIFEKVYENLDFDENNLNVLLHGDSWINNFMFRYDSFGVPDQIKLIDFQIIHYNSPAIDLLYFIFSSINAEIIFDLIDLFLKIYYESFIETLSKLGHQTKINFGLSDLEKEFNNKLHWGLLIFCSIYPLIDANEVFDPDEYFTEDIVKTFEKVYHRKEVREGLKKGFVYFEKMGVF